jgi:tetratricopeptide (TPR) repeat protein
VVLNDVDVGRDLLISISASIPAIIIPHQIPAPPADFAGRDSLLAELEANQNAAGFVISGMGGAGKTALGLKLAEHLKSRYSDSQFYLDLQGTSIKPLSRRDIMAHVVSSLRPDAEIPKRPRDLEGLYRSVLDGQRAILFFDNAKDASQIGSLLPPRDSLVIVTSRNYFSLPGFESRKLDVLLPSEASVLLLRICPRLDSEVENLARVCGYLPFALRLAGGFLTGRRDVSPKHYIQQLTDSEKRLELIDGSLSLSYEILDSKTRAFWALLAVFRAAFDAPAAAAVWNLQLADASEKLSQILSYSMLEWDDQTKRYRLHDLAQVFADKKVESQERPTAQCRHAVHYEEVARAAYDVIVSRKTGSVDHGFELLYSDWVNIAAGQSWASRNIDQSAEAAHLCHEYATRAAFFHLMKHDPPELVRWLEAAVLGDRRLGDKKAEATDSGHLGNVQVLVGDVRAAIKWHYKALSISREIGDREDEADELYRLMELYAMKSEFANAIKQGESALLIHRELGDRGKEVEALTKLGELYKARGDQSRSIQYYENAVHQMDRPLQRAESLVELGKMCNDASKTISHYEAAISIFRRLGKTIEEGQTLVLLGDQYRDRKDVSQSVNMFENAAGIFKRLGDRRQEANALVQAGVTYAGSDDSERAIEFADRSLAIARQIEDHELIVLNLQVLVSVHGQWGRVELEMNNMDSALRHLKGQLAAAKELRAIDKPLPEYMDGDALLALGALSLKRNNPKEAKNYLTEGLAIARSTGNREEEAKFLDTLGLALFSLGERVKAIEHARQALLIFESLNDPKAAMPLKHLTLYHTAP